MKKQKKEVIKQGIIPEFMGRPARVSSTSGVTKQQKTQQTWKTLKRVEGLSCFITSGFTLIELLVVVLIIGILAAVALPQYQYAVKKSRFAENLIRAKSLVSSARLYYLQHGEWPIGTEKMKNLEDPYKTVCGSWEGTSKQLVINCNGVRTEVFLNGKVTIYCVVHGEDATQEDFCERYTGRKTYRGLGGEKHYLIF